MAASTRSLLSFGTAGKNSAAEPSASQSRTDREETPLFSVVSGNPTDEEIAALAAVLTTLQNQQSSQDTSALALWQRRLNRGQRMGVKLRPGPGSWRRARPQ